MNAVLSKIKPDKDERFKFNNITLHFLAKLNAKLKDAKAILGGSGAKDTWLSGNHDVDIFVLFDYNKFKSKSSQLSDLLQPILKKSFPKEKIQRLHGSRDYFQLSYKNIGFEVIPILKITVAEQAINITDVSPLHSQWVNKQGKKLKDEIRLVKQFCKANNLYGAESYIGGFSGYVLEILTIYYGSLKKLLEASQTWRTKEIIDPSNFYSKKAALFHINKSKLNSPIIVIDPVDKTRNAAAALSEEKCLQFKKAAQQYLKKRDDKLFWKEPVTFAQLKTEAERERQNLVFLAVSSMKGKEDVVGVKVLKMFNFLERELTPFVVRRSGWEWDKKNEAVIFFFLAKKELPKFAIHWGPPVAMKESVAAFKQKNKDTFEEKGRILARVKTSNPQLKEFIRKLLADDYVKERIKTVNNIKIV